MGVLQTLRVDSVPPYMNMCHVLCSQFRPSQREISIAKVGELHRGFVTRQILAIS